MTDRIWKAYDTSLALSTFSLMGLYAIHSWTLPYAIITVVICAILGICFASIEYRRKNGGEIK